MAVTSLLGLTGEDEARQGRGRQASGKWLVDGQSGQWGSREISPWNSRGNSGTPPKVPAATLYVTCNGPGGTRPGKKMLCFPVQQMVA